MIVRLLSILVLTAIGLLGPVTQVPAQAPPGAEGYDVRGVFVLPERPGLRSPAEVQGLIQDMSTAAANRLYPLARGADGAFYTSEFEPLSGLVRPRDFDPIGAILVGVAEGAQEVEVWPVVSVFPSFNTRISMRPTAGNVLERFPATMSLNVLGQTQTGDNDMLVDPSSIEGQDYLLAVILEVALRYSPNGIVLSDFHYPDSTWGYHEEGIRFFRQLVGGEGPPPPAHPLWKDFRRALLTDFLSRVRQELQRLRPETQLSLIIRADGPPPTSAEEWLESPVYTEKLQDWVRWCEMDLLDEIIVLNARSATTSRDDFEGWVRFAQSHARRARVVTTIHGRDNMTPGAVDLIRRSRSAGAGVAIHHYGQPTRENLGSFWGTSLRNAFLYPPGSVAMPRMVVTSSAPYRFEPTNPPPPSIGIIGQRDTAAPPRVEIPRARATPVATPTAGGPVVPDDQTYRLITLRSGERMRAIILSRDNTRRRIVLRPAGGTAIELPLEEIVSIEVDE